MNFEKKLLKKFYFLSTLFILFFYKCGINDDSINNSSKELEYVPNIKYGYDLNRFKLVDKKIRRGDTFGAILESEGIDYPEVYNILEKTNNQVNTRKLVIGKSYKFLYTKDSILKPYAMIYERSKIF